MISKDMDSSPLLALAQYVTQAAPVPQRASVCSSVQWVDVSGTNSSQVSLASKPRLHTADFEAPLK